MIIFHHHPTPDWRSQAKTKLLRQSQSTAGLRGQAAGSSEQCWREAVARRTGGEKTPILPIRTGRPARSLSPAPEGRPAAPTLPLRTLLRPLA